MGSVDAGSFNREFSLQRPSGLDGDTYTEVAIEWGSKRFASGNELLRFGAPQSTGAWVITIRYREDVEASWRLLDLATHQAFQISNFGDPDGREESLMLFCVELQ